MELEQTITRPLAALKQKPEAIFNQIALNLDLAAPAAGNCDEADPEDPGLLLNTLAASRRSLDRAFMRFKPADKDNISEDLHYLISEYSNLRPLPAQLAPSRSLNAINMSMKIDFKRAPGRGGLI